MSSFKNNFSKIAKHNEIYSGMDNRDLNIGHLNIL